MEAKKNERADLEKWRFSLSNVGYVISLGLCIAVFEYKTLISGPVFDPVGPKNFIEEDIMVITKPQAEPPKPKPVIADVLEIKSNEEEVKSNLDFISDIDPNSEVPLIEVPQNNIEEELPPIDVYLVDSKPTFPGGEVAFQNFLGNNIKYPEIAKEYGIQGKVYVKFVIDKEGNIINLQIVRSVDPSLDNEAIRVLNICPKWIPARQKNALVSVNMIIPINFSLK